MRHHPYNPETPRRVRAVSIARRLRREATPAEKRLWSALRQLRVERSHFRRQAPVGPYFADFVCHGAKLVIELDGGAHNAPDVAARDVERQAWIEARGYRVLRVANARVFADLDGVLREIGLEMRLAKWR
jgi:very-short-patch-repair endonuclease